MFLDVRSVKEYDAEHLTKPPRCTLNVPIKLRNSDAQDPNFVAAVSSKAAKSAKLLVVRRPCGVSPLTTESSFS